MRLFLIRHPLPAIAPGTCYGRSDLALAEDPAAVATALHDLLPPDLPLYSSPLRRCRELAERLHAKPRLDARLVELDFGEWEMRPWESIDRATLDAWAADPLHFRPPGGEAVADLRRRVRHFLDDLDGDAVLIVHAGVMKACVAELADVLPEVWFSMQFDYGSAALIEDGRLVWHNRVHG